MTEIESAPRHPDAKPEASCGKCRFWRGREGRDTGDCDCDANVWTGGAGQRMRFWTERETACLSWEPKT
jgi:hypothetical protein